jgi:hypothetical protein
MQEVGQARGSPWPAAASQRCNAEGDVLNLKPGWSLHCGSAIALQWIQTQAASYGRVASGAFEPVSQHDFGLQRGIDWRRAGLA